MNSLALLGLVATASAGTVTVSLTSDRLGSLKNMVHAKRDTVSFQAINNITGGGYYSEFSIGTPPQKLNFHLDTGSSDTWMNSATSDLCGSETAQRINQLYCSATFDSTTSSTYEMVVRNGFDIAYLDGTEISGHYIRDTVTIGKTAVKKQQLGLATTTVSGNGIMGLGMKENVAAAKEYPTILDNMVSQNHINSPAFSMYLNDLGSDQGTILFGGIDAKKYVGDLSFHDIVAQDTLGSLAHYSIHMSGFSINTPSGEPKVTTSITSNTTAILDSGATLCILPPSAVEDVFDKLDVRNWSAGQLGFVDCSAGKGYSMAFSFRNKTINVPIEEMIINAFDDIQADLKAESSLRSLLSGLDKICMFGLRSSEDFGITDPSFALLGDTFLRSAYVVYDQANMQIGLAESNLRSEEEDIHEIPESGAIPIVKGVDKSSYSPATADGDDGSAAGHLVPSSLATFAVLVSVAWYSFL